MKTEEEFAKVVSYTYTVPASIQITVIIPSDEDNETAQAQAKDKALKELDRLFPLSEFPDTTHFLVTVEGEQDEDQVTHPAKMDLTLTEAGELAKKWL